MNLRVSKKVVAVSVVAVAILLGALLFAQYAMPLLASLLMTVKAPVPSVPSPITFNFGDQPSGHDFQCTKSTTISIDWLGEYAKIPITGFKFDGNVKSLWSLNVAIEVLDAQGTTLCTYGPYNIVKDGKLEQGEINLDKSSYCWLSGTSNPPAKYTVRVTVQGRTDVVKSDANVNLHIYIKFGEPERKVE